MKTSKCRGCGAGIIWTQTREGRRMPVDAKGLDGFYLVHNEETTDGGTVEVDPPSAIFRTVHLSHFVTCPKADDFRKGGS